MGLARIVEIELIIFDCDGVLADSELMAFQAQAEIISEAGIPLTPKDIEPYMGVVGTEMYKDIAEKHHHPLPNDMSERFVERILQLAKSAPVDMPSIKDVLGNLEQKYCVASNGEFARLQGTLQAAELTEFFNGNIFNAEMVERGKPAPDLFLYAARHMDVAPEKSLVVEDSIHGVNAGVAAGMKVFGFTGGCHCPPDHGQRLLDTGAELVFDDLCRLPVLIANL